jgi:hypothetical protein
VLVPSICDRRKSDFYILQTLFLFPSHALNERFGIITYAPGITVQFGRWGGGTANSPWQGGIDVMGDTGEGDSHTGTSRKSTLIGAPLIVVSGLDMDLDKRDLWIESRTFPWLVRLEIPKQLGLAKTFWVMILSQDLDAFSLFCGATIGNCRSSASWGIAPPTIKELWLRSSQAAWLLSRPVESQLSSTLL